MGIYVYIYNYIYMICKFNSIIGFPFFSNFKSNPRVVATCHRFRSRYLVVDICRQMVPVSRVAVIEPIHSLVAGSTPLSYW